MFWRFSLCSTYCGFLGTGFHSDGNRQKNAVPVQTGLSSFDLRRKRTKSSQSTCIQDDLRFRSFTIAR